MKLVKTTSSTSTKIKGVEAMMRRPPHGPERLYQEDLQDAGNQLAGVRDVLNMLSEKSAEMSNIAGLLADVVGDVNDRICQIGHEIGRARRG